MEEQYKQITEIIDRLAASNPHITRSQVARAKSMYNGDNRPIEEIEKELIAYSDAILEKAHTINRPIEKKKPELETTQVEVYGPLKMENIEEKEELQQMFSSQEQNATQKQEGPHVETTSLEKPKQYLKKQKSVSPKNTESGYGNANALITLTVMISIITIIMAIFTIIAK